MESAQVLNEPSSAASSPPSVRRADDREEYGAAKNMETLAPDADDDDDKEPLGCRGTNGDPFFKAGAALPRKKGLRESGSSQIFGCAHPV